MRRKAMETTKNSHTEEIQSASVHYSECVKYYNVLSILVLFYLFCYLHSALYINVITVFFVKYFEI